MGPLGRKNSPYRVKLDLTAQEIVVLPAVCRIVYHPYSDEPVKEIQAYCYDYPEIFAEKIRALSERARPRDLYDVIHLHKHVLPEISPASVLEVLKKKCDYKKIQVPTLTTLDNHPKSNELDSEWTNMLAHQVSNLPPKEEFSRELLSVFEWLYSQE